MTASMRWCTRAGAITADNRDAHACAERPEAALYLIADGSTSRAHSGELARALLLHLQAGFLLLPAQELRDADALRSALIRLLADARRALRSNYPQAACSYLMLVLLPDVALSVHEGDCCLGRLDESGGIHWLTSPHCQANWQGNLRHAEIAADPARHRLTRCFSARRTPEPQVECWPLASDQHWLLASDGFWASLTGQAQLAFLCDGESPTVLVDDDIRGPLKTGLLTVKSARP